MFTLSQNSKEPDQPTQLKRACRSRSFFLLYLAATTKYQASCISWHSVSRAMWRLDDTFANSQLQEKRDLVTKPIQPDDVQRIIAHIAFTKATRGRIFILRPSAVVSLHLMPVILCLREHYGRRRCSRSLQTPWRAGRSCLGKSSWSTPRIIGCSRCSNSSSSFGRRCSTWSEICLEILSCPRNDPEDVLLIGFAHRSSQTFSGIRHLSDDGIYCALRGLDLSFICLLGQVGTPTVLVFGKTARVSRLNLYAKVKTSSSTTGRPCRLSTKESSSPSWRRSPRSDLMAP